jgi:sec-independent protein translocase protein TatB
MTPLLLDINGPEFLLLLVLAIILFGPERLPDLVRKAARVVQYLRTVAGSAQEQLSKELGPGFEDLDLRDLNPKAFIQKHLLDEVQPIVADVRSEFTDVATTVSDASGDLATAINGVKGTEPTMRDDLVEPEPVRVLTPFDPDAT